jgi:hypothetical protein
VASPALEESSHKTGTFVFYQKKSSSINQADLRGMFIIGLQGYLNINCCGIF